MRNASSTAGVTVNPMVERVSPVYETYVDMSEHRGLSCNARPSTYAVDVTGFVPERRA